MCIIFIFFYYYKQYKHTTLSRIMSIHYSLWRFSRSYVCICPSLSESIRIPPKHTHTLTELDWLPSLSLCDEGGGGTCSRRELRAAEFTSSASKNLNLPPHADAFQERTHFTTASNHLGRDLSLQASVNLQPTMLVFIWLLIC